MMLLRPWLLLLLLPWLFGWWWRRRRAGGGWARLIQPDLLQALEHHSGHGRRWPDWALGLAGVLIIVALAGPARYQAGSSALSQGNLVVVLDSSLSMAAEDLTPTRLERARRAVLDWAGSGLFERTAVIIYAGSAHWLMPLTRDVDTLALQLEQLDPFLMPRYGNRPDLAFALLAQKQPQLAGQTVHRLWLTDDPDPQRLAAVKAATGASGRTWIMAVGTENGGPIPLPNGDGFVTDGERLVVASLDRDAFERAARQLDADLLGLGTAPRPAWLSASRSVARNSQQVQDFGPWLLVPALLLLLPWYRSGLVFALALVLWQPPAAMAQTAAPWLNAEQRAYRAWQAGEAERSRELSDRPALLGQLAFEAGDYETAAEFWADLDTPDAHYNRGNALAYQGKLEQALAAYDRALASGEHPAARHNRDRVEAFLQNEPPPQPQNSPQPAPSDDLDARPDSEETPAEPTESDPADSRERMENARLDQLLNRVPPPRATLLERRLQQEYRQAPVDDAGATLW